MKVYVQIIRYYIILLNHYNIFNFVANYLNIVEDSFYGQINAMSNVIICVAVCHTLLGNWSSDEFQMTLLERHKDLI